MAWKGCFVKKVVYRARQLSGAGVVLVGDDVLVVEAARASAAEKRPLALFARTTPASRAHSRWVAPTAAPASPRAAAVAVAAAAEVAAAAAAEAEAAGAPRAAMAAAAAVATPVAASVASVGSDNRLAAGYCDDDGDDDAGGSIPPLAVGASRVLATSCPQ